MATLDAEIEVEDPYLIERLAKVSRNATKVTVTDVEHVKIKSRRALVQLVCDIVDENETLEEINLNRLTRDREEASNIIESINRSPCSTLKKI